MHLFVACLKIPHRFSVIPSAFLTVNEQNFQHFAWLCCVSKLLVMVFSWSSRPSSRSYRHSPSRMAFTQHRLASATSSLTYLWPPLTPNRNQLDSVFVTHLEIRHGSSGITRSSLFIGPLASLHAWKFHTVLPWLLAFFSIILIWTADFRLLTF